MRKQHTGSPSALSCAEEDVGMDCKSSGMATRFSSLLLEMYTEEVPWSPAGWAAGGHTQTSCGAAVPHVSTGRGVLTDVTGKSHMPQEEERISSSHTMQEARRAECQHAMFSASSEGQRLAPESSKRKNWCFPHF